MALSCDMGTKGYVGELTYLLPSASRADDVPQASVTCSRVKGAADLVNAANSATPRCFHTTDPPGRMLLRKLPIKGKEMDQRLALTAWRHGSRRSHHALECAVPWAENSASSSETARTCSRSTMAPCRRSFDVCLKRAGLEGFKNSSGGISP
ncbi:hypothetical protein VTO42DRAFT_786 [Malbranchea cinnamomea]